MKVSSKAMPPRRHSPQGNGGQDEPAAGLNEEDSAACLEGDLSSLRGKADLFRLFENLGPRSSGPARPKDLSARAFGDLVASALPRVDRPSARCARGAMGARRPPELIRKYLEFFRRDAEEAGTPPPACLCETSSFGGPMPSLLTSFSPLSAVATPHAPRNRCGAG